MMIDRTTKFTLIAIAAALWLHLIAPLWKPTPALAQSAYVASQINSIARDVSRIQRGSCSNRTIC